MDEDRLEELLRAVAGGRRLRRRGAEASRRRLLRRHRLRQGGPPPRDALRHAGGDLLPGQDRRPGPRDRRGGCAGAT